MKNLLAEIAKQLVNYPDQVRVNEIDGGHTLVLELFVAKQDIGKVIGKKGQNIGAIRTVMNAASAEIQKRIIVEVLEYPLRVLIRTKFQATGPKVIYPNIS